ncbi:MAG: hypothetical protein NTY77_01525 [Elusimicrobia bacterium]|nr:hypothetical protein [Elusimicrobiota bacterium]
MRHLPASLVCAAAALLGAGCSGSAPLRKGLPEQGIAAIILGARFTTPAGETQSGGFYVNLEGEGGRVAEMYRVPIVPHQTMLYQVEPDIYRLSVTRNFLGFPQPTLKVYIAGRAYRMPFPREILRKAPLNIKGKKIFPIGVFQVQLQQALPGQTPKVKISIDDSIPTRRQIVQDIIHQMMDPTIPLDDRERSIAWSRALQNALLDILAEAETERAPLFKTP